MAFASGSGEMIHKQHLLCSWSFMASVSLDTPVLSLFSYIIFKSIFSIILEKKKVKWKPTSQQKQWKLDNNSMPSLKEYKWQCRILIRISSKGLSNKSMAIKLLIPTLSFYQLILIIYVLPNFILKWHEIEHNKRYLLSETNSGR